MNDKQQPTVFIVDDDPSVLRSISRLVTAAGFKVAGFTSPAEFLRSYDHTAPGCVILDITMPEMSGMELQQALTDFGAGWAVIFLTGTGDIPTSVQAMKRGAVDFLTKPVSEAKLIPAIRAAIAFDRSSRAAHDQATDVRRRVARLTPREYEVLQHVVEGDLNKQTADALGMAEKTVKVHRARVMEKMEVQSVAELVRLVERGKIPGVFTDVQSPTPLDQSPMAMPQYAR